MIGMYFYIYQRLREMSRAIRCQDQFGIDGAKDLLIPTSYHNFLVSLDFSRYNRKKVTVKVLNSYKKGDLRKGKRYGKNRKFYRQSFKAYPGCLRIQT